MEVVRSNDDDEQSSHEIPLEPEPPTSSLPRQVIETPKDVEENQKIVRRLAGIDETELAKQNAIFSHNVIDITQPPLPLQTTYNPRPINATRVVSMRNALISEGFRVFTHENRIMIVISPSYVDPSCITMDPNEKAKPLVLKKPCPLNVLCIIGGQHRQEAVVHIKKEYERKVEKVVAAIEKKKTKRSSVKSTDYKEKDRLSREIKELEEERAQYLASLEFVGPWGVLLLDPGMYYDMVLDNFILIIEYHRTVDPSGLREPGTKPEGCQLQ